MALADTAFKLQGRARPSALIRLAREPLLHFVLLGAAIFALADLRTPADQRARIVVDNARAAKLARTYAQQFGASPSPRMLKTLIDNDINEEILYREGIAMGLDRDDEVIRRRVVQKVQFIEQDLAPPAAPSEAALRAFFDRHRALYAAPARVGFSHVYFSPDQGRAKERAEAALATLKPGTTRAPERGDAYPDATDYSGIAADDAVRLFGQSEIARALFRAPRGRWSGPYRSGYGWHLVRVSSSEPPRPLDYGQARDAVRADYLAEAQASANQRAFAALKARYEIVRP